MRRISPKTVSDTVQKLCIACNYDISNDILKSLKKAEKREKNSLAKYAVSQIILNCSIARKDHVPICQDTGLPVIFLEIGEDVVCKGLQHAVQNGVRLGYKQGYLRPSIVDPLTRKNTKDNTPAVVHTKIVKGNKLKIIVCTKGFGSENMSALAMLKPCDGMEGIKRFVVDTVRKAGSNPCPPIIVGVGIGGTMEKAALLAKESLLEDINSRKTKKDNISRLEHELLRRINRLLIGPAGLGGGTTALAVHVKTYPTHMAGLPVAVNISCWASRHKEAEL